MGLLQKVRTDTERFIDAAVTILYSSFVGIGFVVWYGVTQSWLLIPVFGIGVVVLGGLTGLLSQKIKTVQRSIVRETARLSGAITESLRNIELVKSLGLTWPEIRRLQGTTRRILDLEMEKVRKVRGLSFLQGTIINILRQSILFILLWLIFRKALSAGDLISFQLILNTIFGPLQQLGRVILSYRESEASLQAFDRLMQTPIEKRPDEPVEIGEIERLRFDDVVFRYRGAAENAIDHVSFEARRGDTIAFAGPSGSGKSTLVKLLLGLYAPTSGVVSVDGVPINELRYNRVRRQIGFVAQDSQLFSGTIRENLQLVKPDATDEEMLDVLRRASASPLLERSGQGLDTRLGESGLRVSGGERQRLSIARALLREPRLFIFDEATSALDSITEREITTAVREVSHSRQHMVILIAHRLSTIAHADTIHVLERGRVVETGTPRSPGRGAGAVLRHVAAAGRRARATARRCGASTRHRVTGPQPGCSICRPLNAVPIERALFEHRSAVTSQDQDSGPGCRRSGSATRRGAQEATSDKKRLLALKCETSPGFRTTLAPGKSSGRHLGGPWYLIVLVGTAGFEPATP